MIFNYFITLQHANFNQEFCTVIPIEEHADVHTQTEEAVDAEATLIALKIKYLTDEHTMKRQRHIIKMHLLRTQLTSNESNN